MAAKLLMIAHLPVMIAEWIITMSCVRFLRKVRPEIFGEIKGDGRRAKKQACCG